MVGKKTAIQQRDIMRQAPATRLQIAEYVALVTLLGATMLVLRTV